MFDETIPLTIECLATGIRDGEFTSAELAAELIARSERWAGLGAIISLNPEQLLRAARAADRHLANGNNGGPLHGVPLLIKDNIDTSDFPTSAGTPALESDVPGTDATAVKRLRAAGAIIAGKTNLHELAVGGTSYNLHFGAVRNPWRPDLTAGGSSGGSAAAVAARITPGALGTDTNGSVRVPCSFSGVAGFRPGFRRYPGDGVMPPSPTRDSIGAIATTTDDLVLLDRILSGEHLTIPDIDPENLRLGRPRGDFYRIIDTRVARVIDTAVELLADHGATIVDADIPGIASMTAKTAWPISAYEVGRDMPAYLERRGSGVSCDQIREQIASPVVRQRFMTQSDASSKARRRYDQAMNVHRPRLVQRIDEYFAMHDVHAIVLPTVPFPAPPVSEDDADLLLNGEIVKNGVGFMIQNTVYQSAIGIPSLTLPAGLADGLPVGITFDAPRGNDAVVLGIGRLFEAMRGEFPHPPYPVRHAKNGAA